MKKGKKRKLSEVAKRYKLGLIYSFGSQASKGKEILEGKDIKQGDLESDLDLGVVFLTFPPEEMRKVYGFIFAELSPLFRPLKIDLVFLEEADYFLQFEAIKGINLYKKGEDFKDYYEEKVMRLAADWKLEYELYRKECLEAIRDGYFPFEFEPTL